MGLEAYLFIVHFKKPVPETDIVGLFQSIGMQHLDDQYVARSHDRFGIWQFELRSERGLTEAQCLLAPLDNTLTHCSFRFSVISPYKVIGQTFELFEKLNSISPIDVQDTELINHVSWFARSDEELRKHFISLFGELNDVSVKKASLIPIDLAAFLSNEWKIGKREMVKANTTGEIVASGSGTFRIMEKKGI